MKPPELSLSEDPSAVLSRALVLGIFERVGSWYCADLSFSHGLVEGQFEGPGLVRFRVTPRSEQRTPALQFRHCEVRYSLKQFSSVAGLREELTRLLVRLGESVDAWFDDPRLRVFYSASSGSAEALAPRALEPFHCDPEGVLARISPWITRSVPLVGDWVLSDVVEASTFWSTRSIQGVVLDFADAATDQRCLVCVAEQENGELAIWESGRRDVVDRHAIIALVRFAFLVSGLRVRSGDHDSPSRSPRRLDLVHEDSSRRAHEAVKSTSPASPGDVGDEVKLILNSPCGQSCSFCSIMQTSDPASSPQSLDAIFDQIDTASRHGITSLRLSGLDPLTHPAVLDIVKHATERGFLHLDVQSPSTRLADAAWLDALLAVAPPRRHFHIPFYAITPQIHDDVVGRPGARRLLDQAMSNLTDRVDPSTITLSTVVTRANVHEVLPVVVHARDRGTSVVVRLPFPDSESRGDRFFKTSMKLSEVAIAIERSGSSGVGLLDILHFIEGLPPCVALAAVRHETTRRSWATSVEKVLSMRPLARLGARTPFVVCPHASRCELARVCGGEILRAYVMLHGDTELVPLVNGELVAT